MMDSRGFEPNRPKTSFLIDDILFHHRPKVNYSKLFPPFFFSLNNIGYVNYNNSTLILLIETCGSISEFRMMVISFISRFKLVSNY